MEYPWTSQFTFYLPMIDLTFVLGALTLAVMSIFPNFDPYIPSHFGSYKKQLGVPVDLSGLPQLFHGQKLLVLFTQVQPSKIPITLVTFILLWACHYCLLDSVLTLIGQVLSFLFLILSGTKTIQCHTSALGLKFVLITHRYHSSPLT